VILFYTLFVAGFIFGNNPTTVDSVSINAQFRNGTTGSFSASIPASNATIVTAKDGTSGDFGGTGCS
jgi:hypothetical protein